MAWTNKMPEVRKSIGVIKPWNRKEIYDSLIKEAGISPTRRTRSQTSSSWSSDG